MKIKKKIWAAKCALQVNRAMEILPKYIQPMVQRCPKTGKGVHSWLFTTALRLHHHLSPHRVEALLWYGAQNCGRIVPREEIRDAVVNSSQVHRRESAPGGTSVTALTLAVREKKWPALDYRERQRVISGNPVTCAQLQESSPCAVHSSYGARSFVNLLFPASSLLCCGKEPYNFRTKNRDQWGGELDSLSLIVPSPMRALTGFSKSGKLTARCLDNTGQRKYLVAEFDEGGFDEQAGILCHLSLYLSLVMVAHSGNKSLHAWFQVGSRSDCELRQFFAYAVSLGADPATWSPCQMVRMPGGVRYTGQTAIRQSVMWFNSNAIINE